MTQPMPTEPSPVDYSDVKKDCDLWMIRCPPGFDVAQLDGHQLADGAGEAPSRGAGFVLRPVPSCEAEGLASAFPSAKKKRWLLGKAFARQFVVTVPPTAEPPATDDDVSVPRPLPKPPQASGLRLRHAFVGGALPPPRPEAAVASPSAAAASGKKGKRKRREAEEAEEAAPAAAASGEETAEERAERKAAKKAKKQAKKEAKRASGAGLW
jgi:hypothetical protein